jgi:hypothetical protein
VALPSKNVEMACFPYFRKFLNTNCSFQCLEHRIAGARRNGVT